MIVTTESGSTYELNEDSTEVRRFNPEAGMRRDDEWLKVEPWFPIEVGSSMVLALEPLGDGTITLRQTTPVVSVTR